MADERARRLAVHGRVQGVFFRASTREQAERHGVCGWVANRPDGSVEAWLEGPTDAVDLLERWIREGGPPGAAVDEVVAEDVPHEGHDRFEVRRG
jgi:acylphosphatase